MVRIKRKNEDWRSARFFNDFKVEYVNDKAQFVSRTSCNRHGEERSEEERGGFAPSCHTYPVSEIDVEVVE